MNNRRTLIAAIVGGALIVGAAGLGILYFVVFAGSSPQKLTLSSPAPSTSGSTSPDASPGAGTWTVGSGSQAGYRVREKLASLSAPSDAVGRTTAVTETLTLAQESSGYSVTLRTSASMSASSAAISPGAISASTPKDSKATGIRRRHSG